MKKEKYSIKSDWISSVLTCVLSLVFGTATVLLKQKGNGAFVFTGIFSLIIIALFLLTLYRMVFFKVLIYEDGFFLKTSPFNGRFYSYGDTEKAWTVAESDYGTGNERYLNIAPIGEDTLKIPFAYKDKRAVNYLVKCVNSGEKKDRENYFIGGDYTNVKVGITVTLAVITAIANFFEVKILGLNIFTLFSILCCIAFIFTVICYFFFFTVKIEKDGFYCRTNFFNGRYFSYGDTVSCREFKRKVRRRRMHRGRIRYVFYFEFIDITGKKRKFPFEKKLYGREIEILAERINKTP